MTRSKPYLLVDERYDIWIEPTEPLFCDIETHGLYLEVCLFQMYQEGWALPVVVKYPNIQWLNKLIRTKYTVWYNASYDLGTLGISPEHYDDLFHAAKTAYPELDSHALDAVEEHLGITCHNFVKEITEHLGIKYPNSKSPKGMTKKDMQKSFASAKCKNNRSFTLEQLKYAAVDTIGLAEMWPKRKLQRVINENKAYASDIQGQKDALIYQYNGMPVAQDRLGIAMRKATRNFHYYTRCLPKDLNTNSPKQIKEYFASRDVKLYPDKKTGKPSTGESSLKKLHLQDGIKEAEYILKSKKNNKEISTLNIYSQAPKIKTFLQAGGAVTGRFKSTGGDREDYTNLQQIPRKLKYVFGYPEDSERIMVNADYGTAELIAGCAIFKVPTMREQIMDGLDLHTALASRIANVPYEEVTKKQRQDAKPANFGFLFGMGIDTFIQNTYDDYDILFTVKEAEHLKQVYYNTHPAIEAYHKEMGRKVRSSDFVQHTALGRVKGNFRYNDALNFIIQGTIGEATTQSITHFMVNNKSLIKEGNNIVLNVHDSIVGDINKKHMEDWDYAISKSMQYGWKVVRKTDVFHYKDLPMGVDVEFSHLYGSAYKQDKVDQIIRSYR